MPRGGGNIGRVRAAYQTSHPFPHLPTTRKSAREQFLEAHTLCIENCSHGLPGKLQTLQSRKPIGPSSREESQNLGVNIKVGAQIARDQQRYIRNEVDMVNPVTVICGVEITVEVLYCSYRMLEGDWPSSRTMVLTSTSRGTKLGNLSTNSSIVHRSPDNIPAKTSSWPCAATMGRAPGPCYLYVSIGPLPLCQIIQSSVCVVVRQFKVESVFSLGCRHIASWSRLEISVWATRID